MLPGLLKMINNAKNVFKKREKRKNIFFKENLWVIAQTKQKFTFGLTESALTVTLLTRKCIIMGTWNTTVDVYNEEDDVLDPIAVQVGGHGVTIQQYW